MGLFTRQQSLLTFFIFCGVAGQTAFGLAQSAPRDPGARPAIDLGRVGGRLTCVDVTKPVPGLTSEQVKLFCAGADEFAKVDSVREDGLGPTMNFTSCKGCHQYPTSGGSSPNGKNPQFEFGKTYPPGTNVNPPFISEFGPVRVARFKKHLDTNTPDGGVHSIYTITGLDGADGCTLKQEDFQKQIDAKNIIYRIPTPTLGAGLIEQIDDKTIEDNVTVQSSRVYANSVRIPRGRLNIVQPFHAQGSENRNGNDGTIARFGWKAQNKSLLTFSGEAYNVEMGISNEIFPTEREEKTECQFHTVPNDITHSEKLFDVNPDDRIDALSDVEKFAAFMRFLAPPEPSSNSPGGAASIRKGEQIFATVGCAGCHTPELRTSPLSAVAALRDKPVHLYSDLALHNMGDKLADGISQGLASGSEFRSAPLWGLGQRIYFLHDGRTKDLITAIEEHDSNGSDATSVIVQYRALSNTEKQDLLNFLRSL